MRLPGRSTWRVMAVAGLASVVGWVLVAAPAAVAVRLAGSPSVVSSAGNFAGASSPALAAIAPEPSAGVSISPSPGGSGASAGTAAPRKSRRAALLSRAMARGRFAYYDMVRRIAARHSVEMRLVMAIIASESGGDPSAVSPAGAIGLMQLMPGTAADLGVDPWDPEQNLDGAVRYLASLLDTYESVDLSLVAYNAGPGFAERYRAGQAELGAETRAFLIRVGQLLDQSGR